MNDLCNSQGMKNMVNIEIVNIPPGDHIDPAVPGTVNILKPGKSAYLGTGQIRKISEDDFIHYLFPVFSKILYSSDFAL